jgi:hypothetical protein
MFSYGNSDDLLEDAVVYDNGKERSDVVGVNGWLDCEEVMDRVIKMRESDRRSRYYKE